MGAHSIATPTASGTGRRPLSGWAAAGAPLGTAGTSGAAALMSGVSGAGTGLYSSVAGDLASRHPAQSAAMHPIRRTTSSAAAYVSGPVPWGRASTSLSLCGGGGTGAGGVGSSGAPPQFTSMVLPPAGGLEAGLPGRGLRSGMALASKSLADVNAELSRREASQDVEASTYDREAGVFRGMTVPDLLELVSEKQSAMLVKRQNTGANLWGVASNAVGALGALGALADKKKTRTSATQLPPLDVTPLSPKESPEASPPGSPHKEHMPAPQSPCRSVDEQSEIDVEWEAPTWKAHARALLLKNLAIATRRRKTNFCQVLFPVLLVMVLGISSIIETATADPAEGAIMRLVDPVASAGGDIEETVSWVTDGVTCRYRDPPQWCGWWERVLYEEGDYIADPIWENMWQGPTAADNLPDRPTEFSYTPVTDESDSQGDMDESFASLGGQAQLALARSHTANKECWDQYCGDDTWIGYDLPTHSLLFTKVDTATRTLSFKVQGPGFVDHSAGSSSRLYIDALPATTFEGAGEQPGYGDLVTTQADGTGMALRQIVSVVNAFRNASGDGDPLQVGLVSMPFWWSTSGTDIHLLSDTLGWVMLPTALSFMIPTFMFMYAHEAEQGLTFMMEAAGLKRGAYYATGYLFDFSVYLAMSLLLCVIGVALQTHFFYAVSPGIYSLLFLTYGLAQVSLSQFLAVFFRKASRAAALGYVFVVGGNVAAFLLNWFMWPQSPLPVGFLCIPIMSFARGIFLAYKPLLMGFDGKYNWEDAWVPGSEMPAVLLSLVIATVVLFIGCIYFDAVLPRPIGVARSPFFPLIDLYSWIMKRYHMLTGHPTLSTKHVNTKANPKEAIEKDEDGMGVGYERRRALNAKDDHDIAAVVTAVTKTYNVSRKTKVQALDDVSFVLENNTLMGLLGPNGAGKSTLVHLLCGMISPTSGTATVGGIELRRDLTQARRLLGFCPQQDHLWDDLTVKQTVLFYARLRGVPEEEEAFHTDAVLAHVGLDAFRRRVASDLSGGMRRRLCLACALAGLPKIILLDEPTTGLDPSSRRGVWDIIAQAKYRSSILLTTHSMEEADVLADRIAIMNQGKVMCVGAPTQLKSVLGKGYNLTVNTDLSITSRAVKFVSRICPKATVISSFAGTLNFRIPRDTLDFAALFEEMESRKDTVGIRHWSISAATLEEVFMSIVKQDEDET